MFEYKILINIAGDAVYELATCETLHAALSILESLLGDRSSGPDKMIIERRKKLD